MGIMDEYRPFVAYQYNSRTGGFYWAKTEQEMDPDDRARQATRNAAMQTVDCGQLSRGYFNLRVDHGRWLVAKIREIAPDGVGISGDWERGYTTLRYIGLMKTSHIRLLKALVDMRPVKFNSLMCKVRKSHSFRSNREVQFAMMEKYLGEIVAGSAY